MQFDIQYIFQTLVRRRRWIIVPTIVCTGLAVVYTLFKQDYWVAEQALLVRDESVGQLTPLGRFESVDSMQTAQETIYEVSRHHQVLRKALLDVGPRKRFWSKKKLAAWPTPRVVDEFRKNVSVHAPNGAQFGRTELIYLSVKAEDPQRAKSLTEAVTKRLIEGMQELRRDKYQGIVDELIRSTAIARTELDKAVIQLEALDRRMGSDVVELRVMNNESMGDGTLRRSLSEIRTELRQAQGDHDRKKMERVQLYALRDDPNKLIALPSQLLSAQPTLQRLKTSLADAQVNTAQLLGEMSPDHPRVRAAVLAEEKVRGRLHSELKTAIKNIDGQLAMSQSKVSALNEQLKRYEGKFANLSDIRGSYSRLTKEIEQREKFIEQVETDLAVARSNMAAAAAASTIQKIEQPMCGTDPIGPSGKVICLAGVLGGFLTGLGLVWLLEPVKPTTNRRWSDGGRGHRQATVIARAAAGNTGGRRGDDRFGRRASDWMQSVWPSGRRNGADPQVAPARQDPRRQPQQQTSPC
jgi:uncharacterized protein involved in exopolysaccharide biosynthesis